MKISSTVFKNGKAIPVKYTQDGDNISPPLKIKKLPKGTMYLHLMCYDMDIPDKEILWDVVFKKDCTDLPPNFAYRGRYNIIRHRKNSKGRKGYNGPDPPSGELHRYFFEIKALDEKERELDAAILMGVYAKP